jgi:hypothetical protein
MTASRIQPQDSAPSSVRETFELLAFFRPELGIEGLVANLPLDSMTPRQLYYAAHGRSPDSITTAIFDSGITATDVYTAALKSEEFRENFVARFLGAFPEKKRLLFVHVPKCAGSDLSSHLICRFASLNTQIIDPDWASSDLFFSAIRDLVLEANMSDSIYVHGHNTLSFYKSSDLIRFRDEIFTVIRDPISRVISQINYVLTRIFSDEVPIAPDTRGWRDEFGIEDNNLKEAKAAVREIAARCLRDNGVVVPNIICQYLGEGNHESAVEQTIINDLEITEIGRYDAWCRARWGVRQATRKNVSESHLRFRDFLSEDQEYINGICDEDLRFYNLLIERLGQSDALSIKGVGILPNAVLSTLTAPGSDDTGGTGCHETAVAPPEVESTTSSPRIADPASVVPAATASTPLDGPDGQVVAVGSPASVRSVLEGDLSARDLMVSFESLGENCEFGLVQRRCGAELLGLFRFASAPLPKLLAGLEAGFEGLSEPENLDVQLSSNGREYMVHDRKFQLLYHAWVLADEMTAEEVRRRESRRLPLLVRKLVEELRQATKIFVFHGMEPLSEQDAEDLLAHLLRYGPNTLLWVELADDDHPAGTVASHGKGLLKGYIDRFAPGENAHDLSLDCWIAICREAYRLARIDDVCCSAPSGLESDAAQ